MDSESALIFPKKPDRARISQYAEYDRLYNGDHYSAFAIKGEKDFTEKYNRLRYVVANFSGLMSRVSADMLFGEKWTVDFENEKNQKFADKLMDQNQLRTQLYESALANSRRGDSIIKMRVGQRNPLIPTSPATVIIEEVSPVIYFPVLDQAGARYTPTKEVLAWTFKQDGKTYLHVETHAPRYIFHEFYLYDEPNTKILMQVTAAQFGFQDVEETKIDRPLIFHIPNVRDGNGFWGTSDYKDLVPLFFALNNRITKMDNILDKHSDPILAVPPGVLDEKGQIKKEALGMFEVDNADGAKPEYIVWNANLEAAENQVDKLIELLFMMSEIAPATMGMDKDGAVESGRALKFKLLATIRKRNRKMRYYDQGVKDILETAIQLALAHGITIDGLAPSEVQRPSIDWGDGVINDVVEMTEVEVKRVDTGLSSKSDSIARLDGITPAEAKKKVAEIEKENEPKLPALDPNANNGNTPPPPGGGSGNQGAPGQPANPNQPSQTPRS